MRDDRHLQRQIVFVCVRDRLKFGFGFGYGAETGDIFCFGYGRNREARFDLILVIRPKLRQGFGMNRNCPC